MVKYVVDASVGIKQFVPEVFSSEASRLLSAGHELHTPTLFDLEMASICWKKLRRNVMTKVEADATMNQVALMPIQRHDLLPLVPEAFEIADATDRSVYDGIYIVLANRLSIQVVTADDRLVNGLAHTPWANFVIHLRSIP